MQRSDFSLRARRRACQVSLLGAIAVASLALAFAGAGTAAPPGSADLKITKTDSPDPVTVGSTLTYTIRVENLGPDVATGVTVTDQLPKEVDFVSATTTSGKCKRKGRKVTCDIGNIGTVAGVNYGASTSSTMTLAVIPRQAGTITNTASVKGDQKKDPVASNDKATTTTQVLGAVTCRGVPATIVGTVGNDSLTGTGGWDVIAAFGGNDTIASFAGRDLVCAGSGDDYVGAGSAADRVFGGSGKDRLFGGGGPDVLKGNSGNDLLKGNRGADRLRGGRGSDRCRGGAGVDSLRSCER
jgi:uncharacterized repeat protein (TIGR01451 family)